MLAHRWIDLMILTAGTVRTNVKSRSDQRVEVLGWGGWGFGASLQSLHCALRRRKPHAKPSPDHRCRRSCHRDRAHLGLPGAVGEKISPTTVLHPRPRNPAVLGDTRKDTGISFSDLVRTPTEGIRPEGGEKL